MQNVKTMSSAELQREYDAFYSFTEVTGMGFLNEEGLIRFNEIKAEWVIRSDASCIETVDAQDAIDFFPSPP